MPFTASSPIEPPGSAAACTTKLSVVSARPVPFTDTVPASPSSASASFSNAGSSSPSISDCVALPPAPCDIVICSSLKRGALGAGGLDDPEDPLLAGGVPRLAHTTSRSRA